MSLPTNVSGAMGRAERQFREAFERLKLGKPKRLPKGVRMSQNNVAKEAGILPSALRPTRYPELCLEISQWIEQHRGGVEPGPRAGAAERQRRRDLRAKIKAVEAQRDQALAKLVLLESEFVNLALENERLRTASPLLGSGISSGKRRKGHLSEV